MHSLRQTRVLLVDVWGDLMRHRGQNLMAVLTLAAGLFMAGGGLLGMESLDRFLARLESISKVVVWAAEGANLDEAESRLRSDPRFAQVRRVSALENSRSFREGYREAGVLLEAVGSDALPECLELSLRPDLLQGRKAHEVGESLKSIPGVGDVSVDQKLMEDLQRGGGMLRSALGGLGALLLLAAGFATGNVIRLSILAREDEIAIMRLVGATEAFIRTPLLLEGAVLGLGGSALALGGLFLLWWPLNKGYGGVPPLWVELASLGFFSIRSVGFLALVGAGTGALGALWGFWATRRAQRAEEALLERAG